MAFYLALLSVICILALNFKLPTFTFFLKSNFEKKERLFVSEAHQHHSKHHYISIAYFTHDQMSKKEAKNKNTINLKNTHSKKHCKNHLSNNSRNYHEIFFLKKHLKMTFDRSLKAIMDRRIFNCVNLKKRSQNYQNTRTNNHNVTPSLNNSDVCKKSNKLKKEILSYFHQYRRRVQIPKQKHKRAIKHTKSSFRHKTFSCLQKAINTKVPENICKCTRKRQNKQRNDHPNDKHDHANNKHDQKYDKHDHTINKHDHTNNKHDHTDNKQNHTYNKNDHENNQHDHANNKNDHANKQNHTNDKPHPSKVHDHNYFKKVQLIKRTKRSTGIATHSKRSVPKLSCLLEGRLNSKENWFGYIANVTIRVSASMHFEMAYPADRCCQNLLFYLADEAAMVQASMDCHQKEMLLTPRDERMLQLSERTPWAGCEVSRRQRGKSMMVCKGSRSFSHNFSIGSSLTTWYVAVSDCLSSRGLDLLYRLKIVGNAGECHDMINNHHNKKHKLERAKSHNELRHSVQANKHGNNDADKHAIQATNLHGTSIHAEKKNFKNQLDEHFTPPYIATVPTQRTIHTPRQIADKQSPTQASNYCNYVGNVNSPHNWYGFIKNVSLEKGGMMKYFFTQPASMQTQNVILYRKEDVAKLDWEMSCWEKEGVIPAMMMKYQILDMNYRASWTGCRQVESNGTRNITCKGFKHFGAPQQVHLSLSNCRSHKGVLLHYRLQIYGHKGACSSSPQPAPPPVIVCSLVILTKILFLADFIFPIFINVRS